MISATNLTKKFGNFTAVDNMTCQIKKGCIYGLVGSNGAGKSTFLRMVTGIYKPDNGTITINDVPVYDNPNAKKLFAFVPDELYFLPEASINRMAQLYASVYDTFDMERCKNLVEAFQLNPKVSINSFSKGMKRQAAIILALSCRTEYLFFDETFDGLDPIMRSLVKSLICQDVIEKQTTVIITSHSLRELEDICDHIGLLHKGGVLLSKDLMELKCNLIKVQCVLPMEFDEPLNHMLNIVKMQRKGRLLTMTIRGKEEEIESAIQSMNPIYYESLPLTLEEIFISETEVVGYDMQDLIH